MRLYTYFRSSAAFRVRIALNLKGLEYEPAFVHLARGDHREPEYAAVNPQALVPALIDDGRLLTQSLAIEFARDGIRVNAICPGVVFTPLWDRMILDYAKKRDMKPEDVRPYFESKIPLGRVCSEQDVADAAVFLASEKSSYITGQSINVSGGSIMC